jgi:nucleotide-sensitive chloride channel 1A
MLRYWHFRRKFPTIIKSFLVNTFRNFILFSKGAAGISIPYPAIALHAKGARPYPAPETLVDVVYLQLNLHDPDTINSDDEIQTVDITIVPSEVTYPSHATANGTEGPVGSASLLFEALSACANLHPDPISPGGSDQEVDTAPGAGGWITSENMADFMDADGNFTGLGPGAGTVRLRDDEDTEEVNGNEDHDDTKWRKTG